MASSSNPTAAPPNPDPSLFYELKMSKSISHHTFTNPSGDPVYKTNNRGLQPRKPDIEIFPTNNPEKILGVVKLHHRRDDIGIGDPKSILSESPTQNEESVGTATSERMVWEALERIEKWRFHTYHFEFGDAGKEGHRKIYRWRRPSGRLPSTLKELELRVGEGKDGELLAIWRRETKILVKGSFWIRKGWMGGEGEGKRWEIMVLLSGLAIIESAVRRS